MLLDFWGSLGVHSTFLDIKGNDQKILFALISRIKDFPITIPKKKKTKIKCFSMNVC